MIDVIEAEYSEQQVKPAHRTPFYLRWYVPRQVRLALGVAALAVLGGTGCSLDRLLNSDQFPKDVSDPAVTETPAGARSAYVGTITEFRDVFGGAPSSGDLATGTPAVGNSFVAMTGLLSDELMLFTWLPALADVDQRLLRAEAVTSDVYSGLNKVRGQAGQAIRLTTSHLADQPALAGHLYALQGYAELFLAELFCSGIPLSTIDSGGGYTYRPGSSTVQVLTHAVALFDTALTMAGDSAAIMDMARVGRARALLGMGRYTEAAEAVAGVADGYRRNVIYNSVTTSATSASNFARTGVNGLLAPWEFTVPDQEGFNGLAWRTSEDPRAQVAPLTYTDVGGTKTTYHPIKYTEDGSTPIVLASGVEARLIEAEAALQVGSGAWLTALNALRTDGTFDITATSPPDTLWHMGSGGIAGLAPLADPGTTVERVNLLFRERAFWLYLTGHRQGDLRRLIRQYDRRPQDLYPIGGYPVSGTILLESGRYSDGVTAPIPAVEKLANSLYTGCISREA